MKREKVTTKEKDDIAMLYEAVQKYVENHGGSVVVIGGIALVQESPLKYNYGIMVRCTGKKPNFAPQTRN